VNILFLTHIFSDTHVGGESQGTWGLSNALAKLGVKIFVVSTFTEIIENKLHPNIKIYTVPGCKKQPNFTKPYMLKTFFYSLPIVFFKKIDIIHLAPTNGPHPYSKFKIKPFVSTADLPYDYEDKNFLGDINYDRQKKWEEISIKPTYSFFEKIFNKFSKYFYQLFIKDENFPRSVDVYGMRETKIETDLKEKGYQSKFVSIPMAVDSEKFDPTYQSKFRKNPNVITFLFLSMVSKRKGTHYLIQAFNQLCQKHQNVKLIIAGEGAKSTVEDFKKLASQNKKIEFVGKVVGDERLDYLSICDVFVLDALGQFGLYKAHVEAMSMSKPVILAKDYDTHDFEQKKLGIPVEHGNVNELAEAIEKFVNNQSLINEYGKSSRDYIIKNHEYRVLAQRMKDAYQELINKK